MVAWISTPLAPAVILLLSAFVLSVGLPRLPAERLTGRAWVSYIGPGLVGLGLLSLGGLWLMNGGEVPTSLVSSWRVDPAAPAASLSFQLDRIGLTFGVVSGLLLLVVALLTTRRHEAEATALAAQIRQWRMLARWLLLGTLAWLLFSAANSVTTAYALIALDSLLAVYWLRRAAYGLAVARLFLGLLTAGAWLLSLAVAGASTPASVFLLGLALWLRLGLYPLLEIALNPSVPPEEEETQPIPPSGGEQKAGVVLTQDDSLMIYSLLSLSVGLYVAARILPNLPLGGGLAWLSGGLLLLHGGLAWLNRERRVWLSHLLAAQALLPLLVAPLEATLITVYSVGLILSLAALWFMPQPVEGASRRGWVQRLPALAATLTLIGLPLTLGWLPRLVIHQALFAADRPLVGLVVILGEALALSNLSRWWLLLQADDDPPGHPAIIGWLLITPWLIPGAAIWVAEMLLNLNLIPLDFEQAFIALVMLALILGGAIVLGYFRATLLRRLRLSPAQVELWLDQGGRLVGRSADQTGKWLLRVSVVFEGQHYLGWAVFAAIVGTLIILLRT